MMDVQLKTVTGELDASLVGCVDDLLQRSDICRDDNIEFWALAFSDNALIGCMALANDAIRCTAIDSAYQSRNLLAPLLAEVRYAAIERGRPQLFCYTKPQFRGTFAGLGFWPIAEVPGLVTLLEDDPRGVERYSDGLVSTTKPGTPVGAVVINANPFTLGHEYLIREAARVCAVVHVFVVGEENASFSYADRYAMVSAGVAAMPERDQIVVQAGSRYVVSRHTFPQYFLKDAADITRAYTGIDLQLFRDRIAPPLGVRHRFVGTEPTSKITAQYNKEMAYWLQDAISEAPAIEVHEIHRIGAGDAPVVSASTVRSLLAECRLKEAKQLLPPTTYDYLVFNMHIAQDPVQYAGPERRSGADPS